MQNRTTRIWKKKQKNKKRTRRIFLKKPEEYESGPGSSVGISTDYGLDGPGSNSGGDEIFRPSKPILGLTQPPVQSIGTVQLPLSNVAKKL